MRIPRHHQGNPNLEHTLGGGFKYFLFSSLFGEMIQFDYIIFFKGVGSTTNLEQTSFLQAARGGGFQAPNKGFPVFLRDRSKPAGDLPSGEKMDFQKNRNGMDGPGPFSSLICS